MAEITRKRTGELLRGLFGILLQHPDGLRGRAALEKLAASVQLTPHEAGNYEGGGDVSRRFEWLVRFATIACVKAGWLVKQKGTWFLTEDGRQAYQRFTDPEDFQKEAARRYREWKSSQGKTLPPFSPIADEAVEQNTAITFEKAEEQAQSEIEKFLKDLNPYDFQGLVADLLKGMGYFVSWNAPPGKDGGVDIIAHPDPLGTRPPRLKVQVKRHADSRVDRQTVQSFISTIGEDDAGLFVCTSGFTKDAEDYARGQERRKIMLIDLSG
jgi:restriction system protein